MPPEASQPCSLYTLPANATERDLELGYVTRGAQIVSCDAARQTAVNIHAAEHKLEDQLATYVSERDKPWWQFWPTRVARDTNR